MKIGNDWKIESDSDNIILMKSHVSKKGKNEGEEYWTTEGFYSSPKSALRALALKEIKGTGIRDLETVVDKVEELFVWIDRLENSHLITAIDKDNKPCGGQLTMHEVAR